MNESASSLSITTSPPGKYWMSADPADARPLVVDSYVERCMGVSRHVPLSVARAQPVDLWVLVRSQTDVEYEIPLTGTFQLPQCAMLSHLLTCKACTRLDSCA